MLHLGLLLAACTLPAADAGKNEKPKSPPARVVVTAELACLHCSFGEGDGCAPCLKLDEVTPLILTGKVTNQVAGDILSARTVAVEGVLTARKDGRLVLTAEKAVFVDDKNRDQFPAKTSARIVGQACCGSCDLMLCDECTLAIVNAGFPIVLDGKLSKQHAEAGEQPQTVTADGRLFLDKRGLVRLDATKTTFGKK